MTFLPIVSRELVVTARRPGTYWLRFWAAAGALVVFFVLRLRPNSRAVLGHDILNALGVGALGFAMFAGVFLTADSLSAEKREGTLGLLFLTDLKGYDVVLGKLAANSLHAFFGLLAVFPVMALPLLIGGVSGAEFWRLVLVFIVTLFFSLSVGILVSAASTDARQAMAGTFLWIIVSGGVLPVLWWLVPRVFSRARLDFLLWSCPPFAYLNGFDAKYMTKFGPSDYWRSLAVIFFVALASILAASLILPRTWQRDRSDVQKSGTVRPRFFSQGHKSRRPSGLIEKNPFYWLALGGGSSQRAMTFVLLIFIPLWAIFMFVSLDGSKSHGPILTCLFIAMGLHLTAKVLIAAESGRRFNGDRQSGALELLLVTPLAVPAILAGQRQALGTHFKGTLWVLCLVNVALAGWVLGFSGPLDMDAEDQGVFVELFAGGLLVLLLDYRAMVWVGMWHGLTAKNHQRAVLRTVGQIMALPWLTMFLLFFLQPRFGPGESGPATVFAIWFGLAIIIDAMSTTRARQRLEDRFVPWPRKDMAAKNSKPFHP